MTDQSIKTAIKAAEKDLETERVEKLKKEIYDFLKQELETIESIDKQVRKLKEDKRVHEENIKNVKQGNFKAIEKRKKTLQASWPITWDPGKWETAMTYGSAVYTAGPAFYTNTVAGTTIETTAGNTYIF